MFRCCRRPTEPGVPNPVRAPAPGLHVQRAVHGRLATVARSRSVRCRRRRAVPSVSRTSRWRTAGGTDGRWRKGRWKAWCSFSKRFLLPAIVEDAADRPCTGPRLAPVGGSSNCQLPHTLAAFLAVASIRRAHSLHIGLLNCGYPPRSNPDWRPVVSSSVPSGDFSPPGSRLGGFFLSGGGRCPNPMANHGTDSKEGACGDAPDRHPEPGFRWARAARHWVHLTRDDHACQAIYQARALRALVQGNIKPSEHRRRLHCMPHLRENPNKKRVTGGVRLRSALRRAGATGGSTGRGRFRHPRVRPRCRAPPRAWRRRGRPHRRPG
jgi:hypothetical protein